MNTTAIYTRAEAAQFLRISTRTLDRYQQEGLVKKHQAKQNGRVTYLERDLLRFQNGASKTKDSKERSDESLKQNAEEVSKSGHDNKTVG